MSEVAKRLVTAAVLLAVVVGALLLLEFRIPGPWKILVAVACALAAWEWSGLLGLRGGFRLAYVAAGAFVAWGASLLGPPDFEVASWVTLGLWGLALLRVVGVPFPAPAAERMFFGMLGLCAIPMAGLILVRPLGVFLWVLLVVVIVADTAAYVFGRRFGRTALAPDISPGKTRAGLVGALLTASGTGLLIAWSLDFPPSTWFSFVCLALLTACFGVVGDLSASLLKRRAKVKDSGWMLPGHGGVLDRVDGLLAATVAFILAL